MPKKISPTTPRKTVPISNDTEILKLLEEEYKVENRKHLAFILEYIKDPVLSRAWKKIYGANHTNQVASVLGSRILKRYSISFTTMLELSGHGEAAIAEALNKLKDKYPDKYLKHLTTLHGLDLKRIEHSGQIEIPTIIVTHEKLDG